MRFKHGDSKGKYDGVNILNTQLFWNARRRLLTEH